MPGIPTKLVIAEQVFKKLLDAGAAQADPLKSAKNLPYAYLGAVGADLGDFLSARPDIGFNSPNTYYFQVWLHILELLAGSPAKGSTPEQKSFYSQLQAILATLKKLRSVIAGRDKWALIGMIGELQGIEAIVKELKSTVSNFKNLQQNLVLPVLFSGPDVTLSKVSPSTSWTPRDTLHASHPGRFLQALLDLAESAKDDRLKAYALGAIVGYGVDLCGSPYVNSVVGSPYRNHWWRHRWIQNYIDTWVYGFYKAGGGAKVSMDSTGVPNPLYTNWSNLCCAKMQKYIELNGIDEDSILKSIHDGNAVPAVLPKEFLAFWLAAYEKAYGKPSAGGGVDESGLQSAYAMTWLILWLQTSGEVIPCMPVDRINYPDDCGERPDWIAADGSVATGGTVTSPPMPDTSPSPDVLEIVCGVILAILGLLTWNYSAVGGGIALIIGGAMVADGATDPDWDQLQCYTDWVFVYFYNLTNAFHDLLKWAGLGFPYTQELAHNSIALKILQQVMPTDAALNTVRSRAAYDYYPASRWLPKAPPNFITYPTESLESPNENAYPTSATWPSHFADGLQFTAANATPKQVNALNTLSGSTPLARDATEWQARRGKLAAAKAVDKFFGNAVDVSMDLIQNAKSKDFLDWDLDGDPGIGFPTWLLPKKQAPRSTAIPE